MEAMEWGCTTPAPSPQSKQTQTERLMVVRIMEGKWLLIQTLCLMKVNLRPAKCIKARAYRGGDGLGLQRLLGARGGSQRSGHGLSHPLGASLLLLPQHLAPVAGIEVGLGLGLLPPQPGQLALHGCVCLELELELELRVKRRMGVMGRGVG